MRCRKIHSYLNAYADGELPEKQRGMVKAHLVACEACQKKLEEICSLDGLLRGSLPVPPVPDGFFARIMGEARRRKRATAVSERRFPPFAWNPLRWLAGLSAPMRIAIFVTVILALVTGLSLDGGRVSGRDVSSASGKNLYGLEWFDPTPPGSLVSVYLAMTTQPYQEGNRR